MGRHNVGTKPTPPTSMNDKKKAQDQLLASVKGLNDLKRRGIDWREALDLHGHASEETREAVARTLAATLFAGGFKPTKSGGWTLPQ